MAASLHLADRETEAWSVEGPCPRPQFPEHLPEAGPVLGTGDTTVSKTDEVSILTDLTSRWQIQAVNDQTDK